MPVEIFVFLFGLAAGSFLNVCIHRLPRRESIVSPGSRCPNCSQAIRWFDNIPLLGFLVLGGRCRSCRGRISFRYPAVELASGILWILSWRGMQELPLFGVQVIFFSLLLVVSVTDLETGLIPDEANLLGMGAGLVSSFLIPGLQGTSDPFGALIQSAVGLLVGGALIYGTGVIGNWIFQRESMGGGDVKLMALIGSFLGWQKVLLVFFTAPLFALPFALYTRWVKKEKIIPYGPFLALAAGVLFFYGNTVWRYFLTI